MAPDDRFRKGAVVGVAVLPTEGANRQVEMLDNRIEV
jgi:hypothetical protein